MTLTKNLQTHLGNLPPNANADPEIAAKIAEDAASQWREFLRGLWLYQHHPLQRDNSAWQVITTIDAVALKRLKPKTASRKPIVLLIPSLINRFHILDLHPDHSFAHYLQQQGYDVHLIDWHHDTDKILPDSIERCIMDYLLPLQDAVGKPHHVIGYCMGGTLALAAAVLQSKQITSLTAIATPWDFHQPSEAAALQFGSLLHAFGNSTTDNHIKSEWLQMLFWQRDPLAALRKFQTFAQMVDARGDTTNFVLAEDWLNSGVDLPTGFLHDCANQWFGDNTPKNNNWHVGKHLIDLNKLAHLPMHIVSAQRDKLVPPDSSHAIQNNAPHAINSLFETGHIGLFAGAKSQTQVWPHVQQFLTDHNA